MPDVKYISADQRYSKATSWDGVGYISVQYPDAADQTVTEQITEVLGKLDYYMKELGSDKSKLLKVTLFFANLSDFDAINLVWDAWIVPGQPPARSPVLGPLLRPDVFVAAEAIVAIG